MKALALCTPKSQWATTEGLQLIDAQKPQITANAEDDTSVIVRPIYAGFCGSDRNVWHRKAFGDLIYDSLGQQSFRILGHEFVGRVESVGPDVNHLTVGDIVSSESHVFCGNCIYCKQGLSHVCVRDDIIGFTRDGGFSEFVKLPAKLLWAVDPQKIRLEVAALMEPIGNAVHACSVTPVRDKTIAIFGCGSIGLFTILIARALGAKKILGIDPDPSHTTLAKKLGADEVLVMDPKQSVSFPFFDTKLVADVRSFFEDSGPDIAFEMAGHNSSVNHAIAAARREGHIILFGLKAGTFTLPHYTDIIMHGKILNGVIGRRLFATWIQTQAILETHENGVQEAIFRHILQEGKGTIMPLNTFDPKIFAEKMDAYPKVMLQTSPSL